MASLESKIQAQKNLAISYRRVGNLPMALSAMKRMKLYRAQLARRQQQRSTHTAVTKQLSALRQTQSANAAGLQKLKARRAAVSVKSPATGGGGGGGGGGGSPPSIVQTTNEHMLGVFPKDGIVDTTVRKTFTGNKRGSVRKHLRQKARGAVKTVKSAVGLDGGSRRRRRTRKRRRRRRKRRRTRQRSRKKRGGTSCQGYIIKCPNPKYEACCKTKKEKCIIVGRRGGAKAMCIPGGDKDIIDVRGGRRRRRTRKRRRRTRRRRRRRIGKDKRQLKRVQAQYRRFKIATGDKRFKKTKGLVKCTRVSKGRRTARIYHRRKCRKNERRLSH